MAHARKIDRIDGKDSAERVLDEAGRTVRPGPETGWRPVPENDARSAAGQVQNPRPTGERTGDTAAFDKTHDRHGGKLDHDGKPTKEHPSSKSGEKPDGSPVTGRRSRP
ncbi:MAG TPA: hypothetical protein VEL28_23370 [Candidatus Binatia bacterium]|nr:hypothetical protein [Candidatus Binatia bacterium]